MEQDQNEDSWFTTMVDLYRLPSNFPGLSSLPLSLAPYDRVRRLEAESGKNLAARSDDLPV
jgi:hypothetical protein